MTLQQKRNIFGLLLVLFLVLPTLTTVSWLNYQRKQIKREVKTKIMLGLSENELIKLDFDASELKNLNWKNKHEFEHQGKMYDIVRFEQNNDGTIFWCWLDKEETALNNQLKELLHIALSGNKKRQTKEYELDHFFKSLYFLSNSNKKIQGTTDPKVHANLEIITYLVYRSISSPPPDHLFA
ncbi:MAG: hypothetical protein H6598_07870 [Flavobacteriales bacterium]|nr:hypothetical protein [Flavobacteriales bacterium]MCB9196129.1 hypothetical protein [Flavobacteriales bacterium]